MEQRWLSMRGICEVLQTTPTHIRWLVKNRYIERLPGKNNAWEGSRFLDPSSSYADRLRLAEVIYRRRFPVPAEIDIDSKAVFTVSEVAQIVGWTLPYANKYFYEHRKEFPPVKIGGGKRGGLRLYSAKIVREVLWRRSGRSLSRQKSPFLVWELIDWFNERLDSGDDIPTEQEVAADRRFQKKLERVLKMDEKRRTIALADLMRKTDLAKRATLQR